jgi:hypothetical protein
LEAVSVNVAVSPSGISSRSTVFVTAMSMDGSTGLMVAEATSFVGSRSGWSVLDLTAVLVKGVPVFTAAVMVSVWV